MSRMGIIRPLLAAATALLAVAWIVGQARADVFGTISLLSASPFAQAEYAHDPAVSEDGRYVVFDGSVGGVTGVWRRSTAPGASLEQVAGGDAALPSVSNDGQYVSFTTNEGEELPAITDGEVQEGKPKRGVLSVYVRNMDKAPGEPGAFELVSAKDHSTESLGYEFPGVTDPEEQEFDERRFGSLAAGRTAITGDGRTVVFVTTAQSDLAGPGTPPMQVAVRHLDSDRTELVSVRYDPATGRPAVDPETGGPEPVREEVEKTSGFSYGAVWAFGKPPAFEAAERPRGVGLAEGYKLPESNSAMLPGASISADGGTVAWLGQQIPEQVAILPGEAGAMGLKYAEPLYRRISAGAGEPTRRVVGGSEPGLAACQAQAEQQLPSTPVAGDPCQGPFATQDTGGSGTWNNTIESSDMIPRLSADGQKVAFLASAPLLSEVGGFGLSGGEFNDDAYVVDLTDPDPMTALQQLTQFDSGEKTRISTNAQIADVAISPDGRQVAFSTRRTVFPLGTPAFVSVPAAVPGLVELYDVDLGNQTLTRVTHGYEGGPAGHLEGQSSNEDPYGGTQDGSLSPSFTAGGGKLAFSSTASNLIYGDGNTPALGSVTEFADGADVYLVPRIAFEAEPTPQSISPGPPNPAPQPPWTMSVTASSLASGSLRVRVRLPGRGTLVLAATSALRPKGSGAGRRTHRSVKRAVARVRSDARPDAQGYVTLQLSLAAGYRALASRSGGLASRLTVTFTAAGHPALHRTIAVRFKRAGRRRHR